MAGHRPIDRNGAPAGATRVDRCAAVDVEPGSGEHDTNLAKTLSKRLDYLDVGVYASATAGGEIALGDALRPER